jgi:hypothetical protein
MFLWRAHLEATMITEMITETSPVPRARMTGVIYLLYFLTAVSVEEFVGHDRLVLYDAVNLIAYAFYIAVTLLFYYMFKPVNKSVSMLAAFCSLLGCSNDLLGLFNHAPYKINSLVFFGPYCLLLGYLIFRSVAVSFLVRLFHSLVGSRTGAILRRCSLSVAPRFLWECLTS